MFGMIRHAIFSQQEHFPNLPVTSAEDVAFTEELADEDDREAQQRAKEADQRAAAYKERP